MLKRRDLYREECLWLGLALALLWLILAAEWRGGADRRELWFWVASLLVVTGPMLVVSPVNARMFFSSYLFLCLAASVLFRRARAEGPAAPHRLNRAAAPPLGSCWWQCMPATRRLGPSAGHRPRPG